MARAPSKDLRRRVLTAAQGGKMSAGFGIGIFPAIAWILSPPQSLASAAKQGRREGAATARGTI